MIQIDSREHQKVIDGIKKAFDVAGEKWFVSKLYVGDYMNYDKPRLVVDRKQNLSELCGNVCQQHERFRAEIIRANESGIKLVFLCEHGKGIEKLDDVLWWENPRAKKRVKKNVPHAILLLNCFFIHLTESPKFFYRCLFCRKTEIQHHTCVASYKESYTRHLHA